MVPVSGLSGQDLLPVVGRWWHASSLERIRVPLSQRTESAAHRHTHLPGPQAMSSSQSQSNGHGKLCNAWLPLATESTSRSGSSADARAWNAQRRTQPVDTDW